MTRSYPRVSTFKTPRQFRQRLAELGAELPCDDRILTQDEDSPLAEPYRWEGPTIENRWAVHPMEGWDGTREGMPTEHTVRRWTHFGQSGAKLIWGGEAVAVCPEGRANPNQLLINEKNLPGLIRLKETLVEAHTRKMGSSTGLLVGLQLTHSGRFSKPHDNSVPEPRIVFRHPILDRRVGVTSNDAVLSDDEIAEIAGSFIRAAELAHRAGFGFVDIKHCHGYLGHEILAAHTRPGKYGGSFENRTRFLREVVEGIRELVPDLLIGVRLSAFDWIPFSPDPGKSSGSRLGMGVPESFDGEYRYGFGVDATNPTKESFDESVRFVKLLLDLGIRLVNISAGSPYYNPHIQRPALFPPSDGYSPPEDPLRGVARLLNAARRIKSSCPEAVVVGTGFTYLQEYLPHVAQAVVREGWMDFVGIGRMVLSYPQLPFDSLKRGVLDRKKICRTFSDCTTGPRKGLISGCYPLDPYYRDSPFGARLRELKKKSKSR